MPKFVDSPIVEEIKKITFRLYDHGWDERNGGNISYRVMEEDLVDYDDVSSVKRNIPIDFDGKDLAGMYFLVTATGRYFKNIVDFPDRDLGLVRIANDGKSVELMWGYSDGAEPTSEFPTHLMAHKARLKMKSDQRVVMHCHPTNLVAMTFTQELSEKNITRLLWKMQTESLVFLPEGIGIIPWMVPGTIEIGKATAEKLKEFSTVLWPQHGIFAVGKSIDDTYGLIETIEKAAQIWTTIQAQGGIIKQDITDQNLKDLAKTFNVEPRKEFLE